MSISLSKVIRCFFLLLLPLLLHAGGNVDAQNKVYKDAFSALRSGKLNTFNVLKARLEHSGYPLYDYLEFEQLKMDINQKKLDLTEIEQFLTAQENTLLEKRLRDFWLTKLEKDNTPASDKLFLKEYRDIGSVELQCTQLAIRLRNNDMSAFNEMKDIWLFGQSRPDTCNKPLATWIKSGKLTKDLVWQRIELAINAKQYGLASHLRKYLTDQEQPYVNTWLSVARDPQLITSTRLFNSINPILRRIQVYGLERLARRDMDVAVKAFNKINQKGYFTDAEQQEIYGAFALELATEHDPDASQWYAKIKPAYFNDDLHEWRVRHALWNNDWNNVLTYIQNMPAPLKNDSAWTYWYARALLKTGNDRAAKPFLESVSKERLFQGFFASDLYNVDYPLNLPSPKVSAADINHIKQNPGLARAMEFYRLNQLDAARVEWDYVAQRLSESDLQAAAQVAYNQGWYDRAIFTLSRAENRNNTTIRFPLVYQDIVTREAKRQSLSPAWVFAITRRESAFVPDARSPAGAMGLMQLMPLTAKQVSRELREAPASPTQLTNPSKNVHLGAAYLNDLFQMLDQNMVLATAAYNAGPHKINQWLPPKSTRMDPDIWIENIPYYETREYVKSVLIYRMIYEDKLFNKTTRLKNLLKPIES